MGNGAAKGSEVVGSKFQINPEVARNELAKREASAASAKLKESDDKLGLFSSGGRRVSKMMATQLPYEYLRKVAAAAAGGGKRKKIKSKKRTKRNKQKTKRRKNHTKKDHTKKNRTRKRR